jgi:hypothetical protein
LWRNATGTNGFWLCKFCADFVQKGVFNGAKMAFFALKWVKTQEQVAV